MGSKLELIECGVFDGKDTLNKNLGKLRGLMIRFFWFLARFRITRISVEEFHKLQNIMAFLTGKFESSRGLKPGSVLISIVNLKFILVKTKGGGIHGLSQSFLSEDTEPILSLPQIQKSLNLEMRASNSMEALFDIGASMENEEKVIFVAWLIRNLDNSSTIFKISRQRASLSQLEIIVFV